MGDFGLAVQLEHSCSRRDTTCGTSQYMAPEVYEGKTCLKSDQCDVVLKNCPVLEKVQCENHCFEYCRVRIESD